MTSRPKTKWEFHRSFLIALFPTLYLFIYFYGRASGTAGYNYWYSNIHYLLILKAPFSLFSIDSLWIPWSLLFSSTSYLEENFEILLGSLSCGAYGKRNPTEQRFKRPYLKLNQRSPHSRTPMGTYPLTDYLDPLGSVWKTCWKKNCLGKTYMM